MNNKWEMKLFQELVETTERRKNDTLQEAISKKMEMIQKANIPEDELAKRILYCIDSLPHNERDIIYAYYKEELNTRNAAIKTGIKENSCRTYEWEGIKILTSLTSLNILHNGIEEGCVINEKLRNTILDKYRNRNYDFTIAERLFLSVMHSTITTTVKFAMLRAGIKDFSEILFADRRMLLSYKKIGVHIAKEIEQYVLDEYGISIEQNEKLG